MKLKQLIEKENRSKTAEIASIICKAFKNVEVHDKKAAMLMSVGRKLKGIGVK